MGTFIELPGVNPGPEYPRVDLPASVLPDAGALILIDPTNPAKPWPAGVPSGNIPNVADGRATEWMTGDTSIAGVVGAAVSDKVQMERTSKGALHGIVDAIANYPSGAVWRITLANLYKQYLLDHPTNDLFIGQLIAPTRLPGGSGGTPVMHTQLVNSSSPTANYLADVYMGSANMETYPSGSNGAAQLLGHATPPLTVGTPKPSDIGVAGWNGTPPTTLGGLVANLAMWGASPPLLGSSGRVHGSFVLYGMYIEDLTVSARSYAQAHDAWASYCASILATRYAGDTYTDPATVA